MWKYTAFVNNRTTSKLLQIKQAIQAKCKIPESLNNISITSLRSFDNFLFKFNASLPLVTGELLQNTVDVNNVTYKLNNIKI